MRGEMSRAVVAGHICLDLLPALGPSPSVAPGFLVEVGPLRLVAGGCVGGTGLALVQLGVPTRLVADIGDDELGSVLCATLARGGASATGLQQRLGATTSYSLVLEPPQTDRSFWHHVGANETFDGSEVDLAGVELLHLGYPSLLPALCAERGQAWENLLIRARDQDTITSLDLATLDPGSAAATLDWPALLGRVLPLTDVISPSVDDVAGALGMATPQCIVETAAMGRRLLDLGAAVVMLTASRSGLLLATAGRERLQRSGLLLREQADAWADRVIWVPSCDVPLRTTTGAGDAASAGLLAALLGGAGPEQAAVAASRTAAARVGGLPLGASRDLALRAVRAPEGWELREGGVLCGPDDATRIMRQESRC